MTTADLPNAQWTEEQLESLPHIGKVELIHGKIIMSPANFDHGFISSAILSRLFPYVLEHGLGVAVDSSTGFRMKNGNVLSPDVSFVSANRLQDVPQPLRKFFAGSPDLAVEVLSPGDSPKSTEDKVRDYFENDTTLVWIVDPQHKTVTVVRSPTQRKTFNPPDALSGEDVIPGFVLPVADIFRSYRKS